MPLRRCDGPSQAEASQHSPGIDGPLLGTLLDGFIDYEATRRRIEDRAEAALVAARHALTEAELSRSDARQARVRRGWRDGVIDDAEYATQKAELTAEREAASAALERAHAHIEQTQLGSVPGDAEQAPLDHLARLKQAVGDGVGAAPDLAALRNVIGALFEGVQLVRSGEWPRTDGKGDWTIDRDADDVPKIEDGEQRYWLMLRLRWSAVDRETLKPIGQLTPVPPSPQ